MIKCYNNLNNLKIYITKFSQYYLIGNLKNHKKWAACCININLDLNKHNFKTKIHSYLSYDKSNITMLKLIVYIKNKLK